MNDLMIDELPEIGTDSERNAVLPISMETDGKNSTSGPYQIWVTFDDGYCVLNWAVTAKINSYDWVGMFKSAEDAYNNPNGNVISDGFKNGWQWAERKSPYKSTTKVNDGYVMAYVSGKGTYHTVAVSAPIQGPKNG
jgi:hypothetical protein